MTIAEPQHYYYLLFACLLAEYALIFRLLHSPFGTALRAMRENETACRTSGVDVTRVRVTLLLVSSAIAGAAGSLLAHMNGFISPPTFGWSTSVAVLMMVVLGGVRSLPGAIVGAAAIRLVRRVDERPRPAEQYRVRRGPRAVHGLSAERAGRPRGPARGAAAVGGAARRAGRRAVTDAVLETEGVSKRFSGLVAVDGVDLRVERGEIRGVVGPNGAGKTTLFNLVSGLYPVSGGRIRLGGRDVTAAPPHAQAAAGLGRTYQTPQIFPELSLFDNVAIGLAGVRPPSVRDALLGRRRTRRDVLAGVEEALGFMRLPVDLGALAGALSFGEQKRLEIARALVGRPAVLMLDEPAAGLNRGEIDELAGLVGAIRARGVTVVLIEHNMRVVMGLCDRITVLDFGRKIAEGTADEVRRDPLVIAAYLGDRWEGQRCSYVTGSTRGMAGWRSCTACRSPCSPTSS